MTRISMNLPSVRGKATAFSRVSAGGDRCSLVKLAAELYRREKGRAPARAGELLEGYLKELPEGISGRRHDSGGHRVTKRSGDG